MQRYGQKYLRGIFSPFNYHMNWVKVATKASNFKLIANREI